MKLNKTQETTFIRIKMTLEEAQSLVYNLNEWYQIASKDAEHQQNLRDCLCDFESEAGLVFLTDLKQVLNAES